MSEIVRLNVGGVPYTTTLQTLTCHPDSMLGAMFSGSMPTTIDERDGSYFIDRNGRLFGYVLDFLRSSQLVLSPDSPDLMALAVEADFYQIKSLVEIINSMKPAPRITSNTCIENPTVNVIEILERSCERSHASTYSFNSSSYIRSRVDIINSIPDEFFYGANRKDVRNNGRLGNNFQTEEYSEVALLQRRHARLQLGEYLMSRGWQLTHSDMSTTRNEGEEGKCRYEAFCICYRDRWIRLAQANMQ